MVTGGVGEEGDSARQGLLALQHLEAQQVGVDLKEVKTRDLLTLLG